MKKLEFKVTIDASREDVWNSMLDKDTYLEWTSASWPGSKYEGKWGLNEEMRFVGESGEGTAAKVVKFKPYELLEMKHFAVVLKGGVLDTNSDITKTWVGTIERYEFRDTNGKTELTVTIECFPNWEEMFKGGWPGALKKLKDIIEAIRI